ncbi:succinate dehydrogenase, cytochrome b556 subunit [Fodinicola feengrottensis]|uniref:Succinate dehydrogenase, cytochrome b556 subunit n=1 Tax=Fodinicola feengrottensis TaxID=435914 RepID=A0ABP4TDB8_9ACTN|nr:succinate dehydrogenase, cytochrome b556 subunit [Fodinicola feengrottensis]
MSEPEPTAGSDPESPDVSDLRTAKIDAPADSLAEADPAAAESEPVDATEPELVDATGSEPAAPGFWSRASLAGTHYANRDGTWSWYAHRVTGFLIFVAVLVHVADRALVLVSPDSYNTVAAIYTHPAGVLLDVVVFGAVLYHALNGLRIIAIDTIAAAARIQGTLMRVVLVLWVLVMIPVTYQLLSYPLAQLFGSAT